LPDSSFVVIGSAGTRVRTLWQSTATVNSQQSAARTDIGMAALATATDGRLSVVGVNAVEQE
jgi:hypothetical protein